MIHLFKDLRGKRVYARLQEAEAEEAEGPPEGPVGAPEVEASAVDKSSIQHLLLLLLVLEVGLQLQHLLLQQHLLRLPPQQQQLLRSGGL